LVKRKTHIGSKTLTKLTVGLAAVAQITASVAVQIYVIYHDLDIRPWHVYAAYILLTWFCILFCIFFNRFMPLLQNLGMFLIIVGGLATVIVVSAMPKTHASSKTVWRNWDNQTGWNDGVCFTTGSLPFSLCSCITPRGSDHSAYSPVCI
jgi:choline transport protein